MIRKQNSVGVSGSCVLRAPDSILVPGDISSAAFFMVAAACLENSDLYLTNVGLNPTRTAIVQILKDIGACLEVSHIGRNAAEPSGDIRVRGGLSGAGPKQYCLSGDTIPGIIDELPILAVLGTQLDLGLEVRDAGELRHKESDRIAGIVENLRRMGAKVEEFPNGFRVGRSRLKGATIDPFGDHRLAMALAVAGLLAEGETEINGAGCVEVSFPGFFKVLAGVTN